MPRTLFFYGATVNTPAMVLKMVGAGSQYAMITQDSEGNILDGGENLQAQHSCQCTGQGLLVCCGV